MTTSIASIPRFLLPGLSPIWRAARTSPALGRGAHAIRHASKITTVRTSSPASPGGKPLILEKPTKFNPPSHGARLPKKGAMPKHYGGSLSSEQVTAQKTKQYPGMMAPEGTWAHWFFNSRTIHVYITIGTLTALALATFVLNFTHTSPFKHLLPPASDLWKHPISFVQTWVQVIRLHEDDRNAKVVAMHMRTTDDVAKRNHFRKVHGLDKQNPIAKFLGATGGNDETPTPQVEGSAPAVENAEAELAPEQGRKKWLGIF